MAVDATYNRRQRLELLLRRTTRPIALLGVTGMLIVSGLTIFDVLMRWLAASPISALNEVISMVFAVAVVACIPSSLANDGQLTIDLFRAHFTPNQTRWLDALGAALLLAFLTLLGWQVWKHAVFLDEQNRRTLLLNWPVFAFMYAISALFFFSALIQLFILAFKVSDAVSPSSSQDNAPSGEGGAPGLLHNRLAITAALIFVGVALLLIAAIGVYDFSILTDAARAHPAVAVFIVFILLWAFLLGLAPLGAVLGLLGLAGDALYLPPAPALNAFATEPIAFITNSLIAVLPLFLMMGSFASTAGLAEDIYYLANITFGRMRGGLALATIGGCAGFGCVTGSSLATAATIGRVALPEMEQRGYSLTLSTGSVAAGGTLGALIPPSGAIVIYALLTEASIGQLFIGLLGPALLAVVLYLLVVMVVVRVSPDAAPPPVRSATSDVAFWEEFRIALTRCIPVFILFGAVLGGLYAGIFTASESAAVGAFGAFLAALLRGRLGNGAFWRVMEETVMTTALIYMLIFGALGFSFFVNFTNVPQIVIDFVAELNVAPLLVVGALLVMYLLLGCVMDGFAIMVITVPAVVPVILHLSHSLGIGSGLALVWWGIVMVVVVETGLITPPFGINIFVIKSVARHVPLTTVFRGVIPFVLADFAKLALIVFFPWLITWLPSTMFR